MRFALLFFLTLAPMGQAGASEHFVPEHRVSGIGVARDDISSELIEARTRLMIQSQTFIIMREPQAVAGAKRIASAKLQALFRSASERSGMPAQVIEAVAYLESWGDAKAESPAGPKGIMQISEATARTMGLKVVHATRYKITREKVPVKSKSKKPKYRNVTRKTPYQVIVRDDRMVPGRAVPAAVVRHHSRKVITSRRSGTASGRPYAVTIRNSQRPRSGSGRCGAERHQRWGAMRRSSPRAVHHRSGRPITAPASAARSCAVERAGGAGSISDHPPSEQRCA